MRVAGCGRGGCAQVSITSLIVVPTGNQLLLLRFAQFVFLFVVKQGNSLDWIQSVRGEGGIDGIMEQLDSLDIYREGGGLRRVVLSPAKEQCTVKSVNRLEYVDINPQTGPTSMKPSH